MNLKNKLLSISLCALSAVSFGLTSCGSNEKVITVCASLSPHSEILNDAVKPILKEKGYTLEVTVLDWTIQNESVKNGDYDANYFQHRPYLQQYDSGSSEYDENYVYESVFPVVAVHFEPLRIYEGKRSAEEFESIKKSATYEICNDATNACRALDLLVNNDVISSYEVDENGNPINLPSNITMISEELLAASLSDYDYGLLPCNTALTGNIKGNDLLPVEGNEVSELRANVLAANVEKYSNDATYKEKIDLLADALLDDSIKSYIVEKYNNVIVPLGNDLR